MLIIFLIFIILSSLCVILSKNVVQSVLYLILVFFLCSVLFIYLGVDFIGLIILIVYIGAISVLFLFVVMMLNIRILEIYSTFTIYLPLAFVLSLIFVIQVLFVYFNTFNFIEFINLLEYTNWILFINIKIILIGTLLFNIYYILFIAATLLLFIAMIGVIILTLEKDNLKLKLNYRIYARNINWKYIK